MFRHAGNQPIEASQHALLSQGLKTDKILIGDERRLWPAATSQDVGDVLLGHPEQDRRAGR